jgi:hypothetical protein
MRCVNLHCPGSEAHIGQPEAEASNDSLGPPNLPFADFCNKICHKATYAVQQGFGSYFGLG